MRLTSLALALALLPAAASAATLDVPMDQAVRITLAAAARDVIVGNPSIADVAVSDQHHLVLTGKMGGVTNLIVVDERGRTILNREIVVSDSPGSRVAFISGASLATYVCTPGCTMVAGGQAPPGVGVGQPGAPIASTPVPIPAPAPTPPPGPSPPQP